MARGLRVFWFSALVLSIADELVLYLARNVQSQPSEEPQGLVYRRI